MNQALITPAQFPELQAVWQRQNLKIVLTNGCFDLLHAGHLRTFCEAKKLGDLLVVGLNSDRSVRGLKGETRPLVRETDRALLVSALKPVDYVTIFDEPTASDLLLALRPHVYVKGGDYSLENLPERQAILEIGAQTVFVPLVEGISTSELVKKIRSANM
ncbi:glycerol-3-phosphate cytidylyltransferase [Hydrogenispora ethanolica]|uniref:Glycerol-3-phosphate cytidylyltransferase n=1 Tax=Hydrogenispora ethanolica TaxID=1082276 RepID=A0A4R1RAM3_HYDET|nr:adenylyltransferase/cytidyltransferase family protein [Hydrogenispora ethanolica]TCL62801.1 glycerol-3-phosphate cytidylyltransferase [Hydrogenispora ethanolica]